jgi:hypothetical protein
VTRWFRCGLSVPAFVCQCLSSPPGSVFTLRSSNRKGTFRASSSQRKVHEPPTESCGSAWLSEPGRAHHVRRSPIPGGTDGMVRSSSPSISTSLVSRQVSFCVTCFGACTAFTLLRPTDSPSRLRDPLRQRLQQLRYLHYCSIATGWSEPRIWFPLWTSAFPRRTRKFG